MRIGILENIMTPGGHEVDFDRILVEELQAMGHEVSFYVPRGFRFAMDYQVPVHELGAEVVSYTGVTGIRKLVRTVRRELHRLHWYRELHEAARRGEIDAIVVPTSTYRYLRALRRSILRKSPVPVVFILHGINPGEAPKFLRAVDALSACPKIRPAVLCFTDSIFGERRRNIRLLYPPTYVPRDIAWRPGEPSLPVVWGRDNVREEGRTLPQGERQEAERRPLVLGFFGQYRREKRLEDFLEAYLGGRYTHPVELFVQGATMHPEDAAAFERIIAKYEKQDGVRFLHKGLIGVDWQKAIASVDALLLPYSAPRYRYHWGGMLFTAIGFQKPVVTSDDMNPEIFAAFDIGKRFPSGNPAALRQTIEDFVNTYDEKAPHYGAELEKAAAEYSPAAFARRLTGILEEK